MCTSLPDLKIKNLFIFFKNVETLNIEYNILLPTSENGPSVTDSIVWEKSEEIAKLQIQLTISEILAKVI